jgi:HK97 family phage portal protein
VISTLNTLITATGQPSLLQTETRSSFVPAGSDIWSDSDGQYVEMVGGYRSHAGQRVTEQTALSISAVYRAVNLISGCLAMMPLEVLRETPENGQQPEPNHYLSPLLGESFNPSWTSYRAKRFIVEQILLRGNAIAKYSVSTNGRVTSIQPFHWDRVTPIPQTDGSLKYLILEPDGVTREYTGNSVIHWRNLESNDLGIGLSTIAAFRNTLGLSLASEEASSQLFGNGLIMPGFFRAPGMNDKSRQKVEEALSRKARGARNAFRTPLLEANVEFVKTGLTLQDMQFVETRKMSLQEICILFGIHPAAMGLVTQTQGNAEQDAISFLVYGLQPLMSNIEAEIHKTLLSSTERKIYKIDFDPDVLLRTDMRTRFEVYAKGVTSGVVKPSEARRKENLPHDPAGDDLIVNGANVKLKDAGLQWTGKQATNTGAPANE